MKEYIIFIANYWGTTNGGISTFNYDLSRAIAKRRIGTREKTVCLLLHSINDIEKKEVEELYGLKLIALLDEDDESNEGAEVIPSFLKKLRKLVGFRNGDSLIWIGHDIKTGNYANMCKEEYGGESLVFNHMNYAEYYYLATGDEEKEEEKEALQRRVLQKADWICAVGPVLKDYSEDIRHEVGKNNVIEIIPGLLDVEPSVSMHNAFKVLFFGRIYKKNNYIKQPKLAVAAFAKAYETDRKSKEIFKNNPRMEVYGYPKIDDEDKRILRELVRRYTAETLNITPRKYLRDREKLKETLRASSLCIMISRHEGFGLTAYEAISAGVPVIISDNTGLHRFLKSKKGEDVKGLYKVVHIEGATDQFGNPTESDLETVTNAILEILTDYEKSKKNALRLQEILINEQYTWDNQAGTLLNLIYDLQDGKNDILEEMPVNIWERDTFKINISQYLSYEFLPNMCALLLGCTPEEHNNYVKCVLVRFNKEKKIRHTLLVAGSEPQPKGKTRLLEDGVVGMMIEQNMQYENEIHNDEGMPIFYDFFSDKGYILKNGIIGEFDTTRIPGEQDENLRAILVLPLIHKRQLEGAVTFDFYNLAYLNLEKGNDELEKLMKRGMYCIQNLSAIIFNNFSDEMEDN